MTLEGYYRRDNYYSRVLFTDEMAMKRYTSLPIARYRGSCWHRRRLPIRHGEAACGIYFGRARV